MTSRRTCLNALTIATCVGFSGYVASAAELTLTPIVAEILQPDLLPFPEGTAPGITSLHGVPLTAKVDFFMEIGDLRTDLGFGNMVFNVDFYRVEQNAVVPGWQPDVSLVDANGDLPLGVVPKWDDNSDIGPSALDLHSIYVGLHPGSFGAHGADPRWRIGQEGPVYVGSVYVDWDASRPALLRPYYIPGMDGFSTFGADRFLQKSAGSMRLGRIQFGVPEEIVQMQVLDWAGLAWGGESLEQTFQADATRIRVALSGDTVFSADWFGGPIVSSLGSSFTFDNSLNFLMDFTESSQAMTALIEFSNVVTDVEFSLLDVDLVVPQKDHPGFVDQVSVTGFLQGVEVLPFISADGGNQVVGNIITGTQSFLTNANKIRFDQPIDRIELRYGSGPGAPGDPGLQGIGIHDIYFTVNNPEPGTIALASMGCGVLLLRAAWARRRAKS